MEIVTDCDDDVRRYYNLLDSPRLLSPDPSKPPTPRLVEPARPPRAKDHVDSFLVNHSYYNLVSGSAPAASPPPPPRLPKRRPLVNTTNNQARARNPSSRSACHCKTSTPSVTSCESEEVMLFYSRHCGGAVEWAKYLHKLYTQHQKGRRRLGVRHLPVEDVAEAAAAGGGGALPLHVEREILASGRLQILLLSPALLEFVQRLDRAKRQTLSRLLHPDRVIAIMLGVRDDDQLSGQFTAFDQWVHLEAKDHDLEFVQTVLFFSTQILQQRSISSAVGSRSVPRRSKSSVGTAEPNVTTFQLHPKRFTETQNRAVVIFQTPQSSRSQFRVFLEGVRPCQAIELKDVNLNNPFNLQIVLPERCCVVSTMAKLRLYVDGRDEGFRMVKLESPLGETEQLLKTTLDPIQFMCQSLKINSASQEKIDDVLSQQFLTNVPKSGFTLLSTGTRKEEAASAAAASTSKDEFPTLLHFSAFHGLEKLTGILLDCPGASAAARLKNGSCMLPADLAFGSGHVRLSELLRSFSRNDHVYDYIHQQNRRGLDSSSSDYQVPPPPRPVSGLGHHNNNLPPADRFGTLKASKAIEQNDYRNVVNKDKTTTTNLTQELKITDELLQLLDDFRNNAYSSKEMEHLFVKWKRKAAAFENCNRTSSAAAAAAAAQSQTSIKEKLKRLKASNAIVKLFTVNDSMLVRQTKHMRSFKKPLPKAEAEEAAKQPPPIPGNETIVDTEIGIVDDADQEEMRIVSFPASPHKHDEDPEDHFAGGISSQILPLSRLSLSSTSSSSSPPTSTTPSNRTMAVPNNTVCSGSDSGTNETTKTQSPQEEEEAEKHVSPITEKLDQLKKSTPLVHYFHVSPECEEEPEYLNTPKSLHLKAFDSTDEDDSSSLCISPKQLFANQVEEEEEESDLPTPPLTPILSVKPHPPPPTVTDM